MLVCENKRTPCYFPLSQNEYLHVQIICTTCNTRKALNKQVLFFPFALTVLTYEVYVLTGDKLGAGTKAVVKLTVFGEYGKSGERQLLRSRTHRTKFQRGQVYTCT